MRYSASVFVRLSEHPAAPPQQRYKNKLFNKNQMVNWWLHVSFAAHLYFRFSLSLVPILIERPWQGTQAATAWSILYLMCKLIVFVCSMEAEWRKELLCLCVCVCVVILPLIEVFNQSNSFSPRDFCAVAGRFIYSAGSNQNYSQHSLQ